MKTIYKKLLFLMLMLPLGVLAQGTLSGTVLEASTGQPLPGVNVVIQGTSNGVATDFDGRFTLSNINPGAVIVFSYIGFKDHTITYQNQSTITVSLEEDVNQISEVVVQIGYGTVRRREATTAVTNVTTEEFAKGPLVSADQLLQGRVAGLQVINGGGEPGGGALIRIRSGSSLFANNDPLYVIDGVPVDVGGGSVIGGRNPLATINQNDIESISILKDAAATAIYGSRASNGVVIITTKRGRTGDVKVTYNGFFQVSTVTDKVDVLSAREYNTFVRDNGTPAQISLLGPIDPDTERPIYNTDWQDEIYRTALGSDHNIGISGGSENIVYRASVGYSDINGLLKKDNFKRSTLSVNLTGNFFDNHLKIDFNNKSALTQNNYSERNAIGAAIVFDPTQPVHQENAFGNYFQWATNGAYEVNASRNPVSFLEQKHNFGNSTRSLGNAQFEYKVHSFEDLKLVANFGYDYNLGTTYGSTDEDFVVPGESGGSYRNNQNKKNTQMDLFFNYNNAIESLNTTVDFTAGYSYQDFRNEENGFSINGASGLTEFRNAIDTRLNLQSFFGRVNFSIADKYLIQASYRIDGSSRFAEENRWAEFPAVSAAWRIGEEDFLKDSDLISDFKIRGSWGLTGQQDTGIIYPSVPLYLGSTSTAGYQFGYDAEGNPVFVQTYTPLPSNEQLKWEETETVNLGLDLGLFDDRVSATVDVYRRRTKDLLLYAQNPQGVNFANYNWYNIGSMENKGVELGLEVFPIRRENLRWRIGANVTFQKSEITSLTNSNVAGFQGYNTGGITGGTGTTIQNHQVGFAPTSFYVFEQAYGADGNPIEGVYVDRNEDGIINDDDKYRFHKPSPDVFYGFNTDLSVHNWWFSMQWRGSAGNYNYNNVYSNLGNEAVGLPTNGNYLNNVHSSVLDSQFALPRLQSDYYIQDASFLKLDNITVGYTFNDVFEKGSSLQLTGAVQNVLVITGYNGIDPEFNNGIDNNLYPRPRTYTLGLNINF